MRCGHLFNGISGFGLAASWMGWSNIMHCEIDPFCNRVMNHHFPNSFQHEDITTTDFRIWRGRIDLLTGGFPCQPWSSSGERLGTDDPRHLWPEMLRAIKEIQPHWIVAENVYGIVNWGKGLVFEQIQAEMENEGYEVGTYLLPACGVEAPHERQRTWFVAHTKSGNWNLSKESKNWKEETDLNGNGWQGVVADSFSIRQSRSGRPFNSSSTKENGEWKASWAYDDGRWPTQSPVCAGNDGLSGNLVDITFSDWRTACLKSLGNAIVPQVAYEIFKAIEQYENTL